MDTSVGREVTGSKVGAFCAHSILALEALIHPRALPLSDYSTPPPAQTSAAFRYNLSKIFQSSNQKHSDLRFGLTESGDDIIGASPLDMVKSTNHGPDTPFVKSLEEERRASNDSSDENSQGNNETGPPAMVSTHKFMFSPESRPPMSKSQEPPSPDPIMIPHTSGTMEETKEDTHEDEDTGLDENVVIRQDDTPLSARGGAASLNLEKDKELLHDRDHDESNDFVFPDIVDTDPDSNEE